MVSKINIGGVKMAIQNRFNKTNTIYKITKDIDLEEGTLTIPAGCTLDFQGGSFSNGTLLLTNTTILNKGFSNIILEGSCKNSELSLEWFLDSLSSDYSVNLQSLVNIAKNQATISIGDNKYMINSTVNINKPLNISGTNTNRIYANHGIDYIGSALYTSGYNTILNVASGLVSISNIYFYGAAVTLNEEGVREGSNPLVLLAQGSNTYSNCRISNCNFKYAHIGLQLSTNGISSIENNSFSYCNCGLYILHSGDNTLINNYFNSNSTSKTLQSEEDYAKMCGEGLRISSASGNTTVIGGKLEWNTKGVVVTGNSCMGIIFNSLQFDWNIAGHMFFIQSNANGESSLLNHIINGCRFLGTPSEFAIYIGYYSPAQLKVTGCSFTNNNSSAVDINYSGDRGPSYVFNVQQHYLETSSVYDYTIYFVNNMLYAKAGVIDLIKGSSYRSKQIKIITDILTDNKLSNIKYTDGLPSYLEVFNYEGITVSLLKIGNIIRGVIQGIPSTTITEYVITSDKISFPVNQVIYNTQGTGVYTDYVATNDTNGLVLNFIDDSKFRFIPFVLLCDDFN